MLIAKIIFTLITVTYSIAIVGNVIGRHDVPANIVIMDGIGITGLLTCFFYC
jgi:hypothetical protein